MPASSITGSTELGAQIRTRREALNLSVEQAATLAAMGGETWRRYENGASIRRDKLRGLLRVLRVSALSELGSPGGGRSASATATGDGTKEYQWHADPDRLVMWGLDSFSRTDDGANALQAKALLAGTMARDTFWESSLEGLLDLPRGAHRGQVGGSLLLDVDLPARWETRYDWEFCYRFHGRMLRLEAEFSHEDGEPQPEELIWCFADLLALRTQVRTGVSYLDAIDDPVVGEWVSRGRDREAWLAGIVLKEIGVPENLVGVADALFDHRNVDPSFDSFAHFDNWFVPGLLVSRLADPADPDGNLHAVAKLRLTDPDPPEDDFDPEEAAELRKPTLELLKETTMTENEEELANSAAFDKYSDALDRYIDQQGTAADRQIEMPLPPWPADSADNIMMPYLFARAEEIAERSGLAKAVVWLTAHAWFEGGLAERSRSRT